MSAPFKLKGWSPFTQKNDDIDYDIDYDIEQASRDTLNAYMFQTQPYHLWPDHPMTQGGRFRQWKIASDAAEKLEGHKVTKEEAERSAKRIGTKIKKK